MNFLKLEITPNISPLHIENRIYMILEEYSLWPSLGLKLNYEK